MFGLCDVQRQCVLLAKGHSQSVLHEGCTVLSQMTDVEEAAQQNHFLYHMKSISSKTQTQFLMKPRSRYKIFPKIIRLFDFTSVNPDQSLKRSHDGRS